MRTPTHLWIVGILSLLWNCFGSYDYLMTKTRNMDYLAGMTPPGVDTNSLLAYIDGMPLYAQFGWGLGVWMGLAGSLLLLLRSRWAVWALLLSFIGGAFGLVLAVAGLRVLGTMKEAQLPRMDQLQLDGGVLLS